MENHAEQAQGWGVFGLTGLVGESVRALHAAFLEAGAAEPQVER